MDRVEAYSRLFNIDDSISGKYVRILSKSSEGVPEEVVEFLEDFENGRDTLPSHEIGPSEGNGETEGKGSPEDDVDPVEGGAIVEPEVVVEDDDSPRRLEIEVEPISEIPRAVVEEQSDPMDVLRDFHGHLKKSQVYRKIRNSDSPESLCKSVSSFCTRYLIELHSSGFDSELVRSSVSGWINVGEVLRLLANYVEFDNLNSLAKSVVIIRNFLERLDGEFDKVDG